MTNMTLVETAEHPTKQPSILPSTVLGFVFVVGGIIFLSLIVNNTWLVSSNHPDFVELQRAVAIGSAEAGALIRAADWRLILLFLIGITTTVTGLVMPLTYLVNLRITEHNAATITPLYILLRQSLWVGLWIAICMWLHMHRTLGVAIGLLVAILFILMEGLLLLRRRSNQLTR